MNRRVFINLGHWFLRSRLIAWAISAALAVSAPTHAACSETHRLLDGVTLFVVNPQGRDFSIELDVRDCNSGNTGPGNVVISDLLFKLYAPDGRTLIREIIP